MKAKKNILVAPLNWGIGHATRCVPIINQLIENNFNVIIASSGRSLQLLVEEFPKNDFIKTSDYQIKYNNLFPLWISILMQTPKLFFKIKNEKKELEKIINDFNIDAVISDSRFGFYSEKITSIFITHQLEIQSRFFKSFIQKINYFFINKFNECWVLDYENNGLAGQLSHPKKIVKHVKYIGPQSRLLKKNLQKKFDIIAIVSGPEPQRSIFEKILIKELKKSEKKSIVVQGKPEIKNKTKIKNLTIVSHLKSNEINEVILQSELVICRSGYSTIMDLHKLNKNAILVPTPGQTEQEYLANYLSKNNIFKYQKQKTFSLDLAIKQSNSFEHSIEKSDKLNWEKLFKIFEK